MEKFGPSCRNIEHLNRRGASLYNKWLKSSHTILINNTPLQVKYMSRGPLIDVKGIIPIKGN